MVFTVTACASPDTAAPTTTEEPAPTVRIISTSSTSTTSTTTTAPTTTTTPPTTTATTLPPVTRVRSPGEHSDADLEIHLGFRSEISDVTSEELADLAMKILTDTTGWGRSGFTFVRDDSSELTIVLAEGSRVDEMCLPLKAFGMVSCQNGPIVAINADRWRQAWDGWDATVDAYRHYVITHEVGHLIGLRHPAEKCPAGQPLAAAMDPQTRTTLTCPVNGVPLDWEIEWARNRPAVIGPTPDWDGPKPTWPSGG